MDGLLLDTVSRNANVTFSNGLQVHMACRNRHRVESNSEPFNGCTLLYKIINRALGTTRGEKGIYISMHLNRA